MTTILSENFGIDFQLFVSIQFSLINWNKIKKEKMKCIKIWLLYLCVKFYFRIYYMIQYSVSVIIVYPINPQNEPSLNFKIWTSFQIYSVNTRAHSSFQCVNKSDINRWWIGPSSGIISTKALICHAKNLHVYFVELINRIEIGQSHPLKI